MHRRREPELLNKSRLIGLVGAVILGALLGWRLRSNREPVPRSAATESHIPQMGFGKTGSESRHERAEMPPHPVAQINHPNGIMLNDLSRIDPAHSLYTAAGAYEATHRNIQEIYSAESRKEPWASERERAILDYTNKDVSELDPKSRTEIECRTSSCRVRIYSEDPHLISIMGDYPYACLGRYATGEFDQGSAGSRYADFYVLFGEQNQLPDAFQDNRDLTCPQYRELWLEYTRKPLPD